MRKDKTFIVAVLSSNHCRKNAIIKDIIKAVKDSGAEAFKIQTFDLDNMTLNVRNQRYQNKEEQDHQEHSGPSVTPHCREKGQYNKQAWVTL